MEPKAFIERLNESYEAKVKPLKARKSQIVQRLAVAREGAEKHKKMTAAQISALEGQINTATAAGDWNLVEEIEAKIGELKRNAESNEQFINWKSDLECLPDELAKLERKITVTAKTTFQEFMPVAQGEVFDSMEAWLQTADTIWDGMKGFASQNGIEVGNNREQFMPKDSLIYGNRSKQLYQWACHWGW